MGLVFRSEKTRSTSQSALVPRCSPTAVTVFLIYILVYILPGEPHGAITTPFHSSAPPPQSIRKLSPSFPSGCTEGPAPE